MRRFIWLLLVLFFSVWIGLQIAKDPGLAFFSYRQWSVEMPLWFAALSLIGVLFLFYLICCILSSIDSSFYRWTDWLRWRRKNKAEIKTNRGFLELIEGHWRKAEKYLIAGINQSDVPLINYLGLAKAAHEQAAYDRRDNYLRKAQGIVPHAEVGIGLVQAQLQKNQGQIEQALATLNRLRTISPNHGLVLTLLERIYVNLADWRNILALLPNLYKSKRITNEQLLLLEQKSYAELLKSAENYSDKSVFLDGVWQGMPRRLQKNPQLLSSYVQQLGRTPNESVEVVSLIELLIKKSWNGELVKLYGLLNTADPLKRLAHAERWLTRYPNQALVFLTLGRLSIHCQLWGKARSYFESSLELEKNAETYLEYGKLLEQLNETVAALQAYRNGLIVQVG